MSDIATHGWTAVPVDHTKILNSKDAKTNPPKAIPKQELLPPTNDLIKQITDYAQANLPKETFNHSHRVYAFSLALLPYLPQPFQHISHETIFLTSLLHDIGSTPQNMHATNLSFEFHGGIISHTLLSRTTSPQLQYESITEAIIRHQDIGSAGMIHALGALMQIATILDNTGSYAEFVHKETLKTVNGVWPRLGWSGVPGCAFAAVVREEGRVKPWCHTSKMGVEDFAGQIEGNEVMREFE